MVLILGKDEKRKRKRKRKKSMIFVTHLETTPNPNALKYILNEKILSEGTAQYKSKEEAEDELARALFNIEGVVGIFYSHNYITVTKNNQIDWIDIEGVIKDEINNRVETIDFKAQPIKEIDFGEKTKMVEMIEEILDETIRPGLAMDGGGVEIAGLSDELVLDVHYHGACGSCPSATTGTLMAIQSILQDQFDPRITVQIAGF